ncbi:MAG: ABC transporter transmembrane domain-containing protein [Alphaproteobacteria bacterium]
MDIANAVVAKPIKYLFRRAGAELVYNKLVAPYFAQKSPRRAIAGLVALNAATLGGGVAFNYLGRDIINSFATKDFSSFSRNMVRFGIFSVGMIAVNVAQSHIANRLRLSWGNWAKERAIREWLSPGNRAGSSAAKAELQPEQRITNDISNLVQASEPLTFGLAQNAANFGAFSLVLFNLSPAVYAGTLAVGAIGTWALHRAGKKLTALNHQEAETQNAYRNAVGDANTHTESIALWGGEAATQQSILARLEDANAVSKKIIGTQAALTAIRSAYNHVASVAPHLLIAPAYFKPESTMNVGDAMLSTSATFNVRNSLDWYSQNQNTIVQWKACAKRLTAFLQGCDPSSGPAGQTPSYDPEGPLGLSVKNLALKKPGGSGLLCRDISFDLKPGNRLVVLGESGAGEKHFIPHIEGNIAL